MTLFNTDLIKASIALADNGYDELISGIYEGGPDSLYDSTSLFLVLVAFVLLLLIHFIFFLFNLISSSSVSNLFLSVNYYLPNISNGLYKGYLRVLDKNSATIISANEIDRGEKIKIDFASIVNFPKNTDSCVSGSVRSCRKLSGNPVSYIVKVSFDNLDKDLKQSLEYYLLSLKKNK